MLKKSLLFILLFFIMLMGIFVVFLIYMFYSKKCLIVDFKVKEILGIEFDKYKWLWVINDSGD